MSNELPEWYLRKGASLGTPTLGTPPPAARQAAIASHGSGYAKQYYATRPEELAGAKLELDNTILQQQVATLRQELAELRLDPAPVAPQEPATEGHYQQLYEQLVAALATTNPSRVTPGGAISGDQLAHKIKCKLDMLAADNAELLQICSASNKSSLMVEVALFHKQFKSEASGKPRQIPGESCDAEFT